MSTAPIFAPDGTLGDIPAESLAQAVKAGAKPGVNIIDPNGNKGIVPADRYVEAAKAGAKIAPFEEQDVKHPGFWASLLSDLNHPSAQNPYPGMGQEQKTAAAGESFEQDQARKQAGYSGIYRATAPIAESVGVNVPGMEQSAKEGDVAGVLGHAAAVPTVAAATAGLAKAAPIVSDVAGGALEKAGRVTPKQAAQAVGAVSGGVAGHGTLSAPGAYYGAKGAGAMAEGVLGKESANIPLSEHLANMWRDESGTAPGQWHGPEAPEPAALQAASLQTPGATPPEPPESALGKIPVSSYLQAEKELPQSTVTQKIARAQELMNNSMGGKPLEPNVPIKDQAGTYFGPRAARDLPGAEDISKYPAQAGKGVAVPGATDATVAAKNTNLPEGHTAVDSSAMQSYKYDPTAKEFEVKTPTGGHYVYGDVSPEQADAFSKADSKGKAWNDIRSNSPLVAKIIDGKRVAVKPTVSPLTPASDDLTDILQKSLENAKALKNTTLSPQTAGTQAGANIDTALYKQAEQELGPNASLSAKLKRAQELKAQQ